MIRVAYIFSKTKLFLLMFLIFLVLGTLFDVVSGLFLIRVVDSIGQISKLNSDRTASEYLLTNFKFLLFYLISELLVVFFGYLQDIWSIKIQNSWEVHVREQITKKLAKIRILDYNINFGKGQFLSLLTQSSSQYVSAKLTSVLTILRTTISFFILSFAITFYFHWKIFIVILPFLFLRVFFLFFWKKRLQTAQQNIGEQDKIFTKTLQTNIENFLLLYSRNKAALFKKNIIAESKNKIFYLRRFRLLSIWQGFTSAELMQFAVFVLDVFVSYGLIFAIFGSEFTIGSAMALGGIVRMVLPAFATITNSYLTYHSVKGVEKMLLEINKQFEPDKRIVKDLGPFSEITFKNLSYSYNDQRVVFQDFSYSFKKGKKYGIVGESGFGKSTLIKILLGQILDYKGDIFFNNLNYKELSESTFWPYIAYTDHENFVFHDSVKNNICMFEEKDVTAALKLANLQEEVTDVEQSALELSEGQKQRVTLARVFFQNKPIIILDESLANLDKENVKIIKENLKSLQDTTIIVVSHHIEKDDDFFDEILDLGEIKAN